MRLTGPRGAGPRWIGEMVEDGARHETPPADHQSSLERTPSCPSQTRKGNGVPSPPKELALARALRRDSALAHLRSPRRSSDNRAQRMSGGGSCFEGVGQHLLDAPFDAALVGVASACLS